jgi:ribulose kinase
MVRQLLADATGVEIAAPAAEEPVLLGAAILGSVAAGFETNILTAMEHMSSLGAYYTPKVGEIRDFHDHRFKIFEQLQSVAQKASIE